ncbi:LysR family transcriptional regulator [Pseudomonas sp. MAFF212428]|uniref:LysR family transcriptional regulator n=1 Tax=Pseudomonas brassicae TaxID=2708063 RepID=A0A6B3NP59_9PSED|nr:LysR family transcriptional regulator [Pseudomonas brassicae]NER59173.1 LysR family transcriptional regulator [Pseudomonas brassicae]NER63636.1 LysR family transcriptional regulator [Pseudomonas brassicae]
MELMQVRMFKTVHDTGSIARAAEVLHYVPSNITARIKALEAELGVPLFHRQGRGLTISAAGQTFLPYATQMLALADASRQALSPAATPSGRLRIGAIESSASGRLPRFLAQYHARFPQVTLELTTGTWSRMLDDVLNHRLDGAIVAVDVERPQLMRTLMYKEDLVLIGAPSLGPLRSAEDLVGKALFMWPEGCPYRAALEHWLQQHGQKLPIVSVASYGAIVSCVSAGTGVALVPRGIYEQYRHGAGWVGHEFAELTAISNLFYWHEGAGRHPAREAFVQMLRDGLAEPVAPPA